MISLKYLSLIIKNLKFLSIVMLLAVFNQENGYAQVTTIDSLSTIKLRIDPSSAKGAPVSKVFQEVNFIPLETTKESLFGTITKLAVSKNYYVIYDRDSEMILVFQKDGKFYSKIELSKLIKAENISKARFQKFELSEDIDKPILITTNNFSYEFNFDGQQLHKKKLISKDFNDQYKIDKDVTARINFLSKSDNRYYELALTKGEIITHKFFPFNDDWQSLGPVPGVNRSSFYQNSESKNPFYVRVLDYSIYSLSTNGISKIYSFLFPAINSIPKDFSSSSKYKGKRMDYFFNNKFKIFGLGYTYQLGDNLFFKIATIGRLNGNNSFVYSLKSGKLIAINRLLPDLRSSFLPITDDGIGSEFEDNNFHTSDGVYLYTHISSLTMFKMKDLNRKRLSASTALKEYFKNSSIRSNPVIIQFKPVVSL